MIRLSVNIDHVATLRNARGGVHPDPVLLARDVLRGGGHGITVHLREDRRHIRDNDAIRLRQENILPLTLEIAATEEMYAFAQSLDPQIVCFVPERRQEFTTEGGIFLQNGSPVLQEFTKGLLKKNMDVSFFINPDRDDVHKAHAIGASIVELHTGYYCTAYEHGDLKACAHELNRLQKAAHEAKTLGLKVHAGHGLTSQSVTSVAAIPQIEALNIGHAIISDSLTLGLSKAVREMRAAMCKGRERSSTQSG